MAVLGTVSRFTLDVDTEADFTQEFDVIVADLADTDGVDDGVEQGVEEQQVVQVLVGVD